MKVEMKPRKKAFWLYTLRTAYSNALQKRHQSLAELQQQHYYGISIGSSVAVMGWLRVEVMYLLTLVRNCVKCSVQYKEFLYGYHVQGNTEKIQALSRKYETCQDKGMQIKKHRWQVYTEIGPPLLQYH